MVTITNDIAPSPRIRPVIPQESRPKKQRERKRSSRLFFISLCSCPRLLSLSFCHQINRIKERGASISPQVTEPVPLSCAQRIRRPGYLPLPVFWCFEGASMSAAATTHKSHCCCLFEPSLFTTNQGPPAKELLNKKKEGQKEKEKKVAPLLPSISSFPLPS